MTLEPLDLLICRDAFGDDRGTWNVIGLARGVNADAFPVHPVLAFYAAVRGAAPAGFRAQFRLTRDGVVAWASPEVAYPPDPAPAAGRVHNLTCGGAIPLYAPGAYRLELVVDGAPLAAREFTAGLRIAAPAPEEVL